MQTHQMHFRCAPIGQYIGGPVAGLHLFSYRLKNAFGQCRNMAAVLAVYETRDTAAVPQCH